MKKILNVLKLKWLKDKGLTALLVVIIIVGFLAINVGVQMWDPSDIDLTENKLYSISDATRDKIAQIPDEDEVTIYMFNFDKRDTVVKLAKQYQRLGKNIKVEVTTNDDRPEIAAAYNVEDNIPTAIFTCGTTYKTLINSQYGTDFYSEDYVGRNSVDIAEERITNSILGVSSLGNQVPIYVVTGHSEYAMSIEMTILGTFLALDNYVAETINLTDVEAIPDDCATLFIASPRKDFTTDETNRIKDYINKGGNILWLNDPYAATEETPNIDSILDMYGVKIRQDGVAAEQEAERIVQGMPPYFISPYIKEEEYLRDVESALLMTSGKLEFKSDEDLEKDGITKNEILYTSDKGFFRTDLEVISYEPGEDEAVGRQVIGASLEKKVQDGAETSKLMVVANNSFIASTGLFSNSAANINLYHNSRLIMDLFEYTAGIGDNLKLEKEIPYIEYTATEAEDRTIGIALCAYPIIIIAAGVVVWVLRRRKK